MTQQDLDGRSAEQREPDGTGHGTRILIGNSRSALNPIVVYDRRNTIRKDACKGHRHLPSRTGSRLVTGVSGIRSAGVTIPTSLLGSLFCILLILFR